MSAITTHVLDTAAGRPAAGVGIVLSRRDGDVWTELARGETDADGRLADLLPAGERPVAGVYRLRFAVGAYAVARAQPTFYPWAEIVFEITAPNEHHHVPLLLSPFGYSTYRGS